jgi:hypothetical protein
VNDLIAALIVVVPTVLCTVIATAFFYWNGRVDERQQIERLRGQAAMAAQRAYLARPDAIIPYSADSACAIIRANLWKQRVRWPRNQWQRV